MRLAIGLFIAASVVPTIPAPRAENIDPDADGSRFGYGENAGWINAEPTGDVGPGVQVGDSELSGWIWGENTGWVSLSCQNTLSCSIQNFGVTNDGAGNLGGFAWAENVGWVSFSCANTSSCGRSDYGVTIDPATGIFSGFAWSENVGWISFNCSNTSSCGSTNYRVKTAWVCNPLPPGPAGSPTLRVDKVAGDTLLNWTVGGGASGTDIVVGSLGGLRSSGGNYSVATTDCLGDDRTSTSLLDPSPPGAQGRFFIVRGQNCGGGGSYNDSGPPQVGSRDAEIAASGNDCS